MRLSDDDFERSYGSLYRQAIAQQYLDALPKNVFSIGRAGVYRDIDVDDIILQSLAFMETLEGKPSRVAAEVS